MPDLSFSRSSAGRARCQAIVSSTVFSSGEIFSPLASAAALLVPANAASSPWAGSHTGISLHGATSCFSRNSAGIHVSFGADAGLAC